MATLHSDSVISFNEFKLGKSTAPYLIFKMQKGGQIVVEDNGKGKTVNNWSDFVDILKPHGAAWAAYHFSYSTEAGKRSKLILIQWIGKNATPREKMEYATFTNVIRTGLQGIGFLVQAHGEVDLDEQEVLTRVSRFERDSVSKA